MTGHDVDTTTHDHLLRRYGPLLTLEHIAALLHSTPDGVRMTLARGAQPFAQGLAQCRRRFGRRLYFDARGVAALIDNGTLAACAPARTPASEAVQ